MYKRQGKSLSSCLSSTSTSTSTSASSKFDDIELPPKKLKTKVEKDDMGKFHKAWEVELNNVKEALKFIYRSYIELPKNILKLSLLQLSRLWNKFIGVPNYLKETDEDPNIYKIDIQ